MYGMCEFMETKIKYVDSETTDLAIRKFLKEYDHTSLDAVRVLVNSFNLLIEQFAGELSLSDIIEHMSKLDSHRKYLFGFAAELSRILQAIAKEEGKDDKPNS